MRYKIFKDGESINTIIADEDFVESYCDQNGYTYELEPAIVTPTVKEPTTEELMNVLLGVTDNE